MAKRILYISPSLPVLTCTFIYREIFDLQELGFEIDTVSMNRPPDEKVSPEARGFLDTTLFLDKVSLLRKFLALPVTLLRHPVRTLRCLRLFFAASPMKGPRDYARLAYHLVEACYLSRSLSGNSPEHIHCHFVTGATSIGMFLSTLTGVPFSFTMHASAIWIDPIALRNKLEESSFCASISEYNKRYVLSTYGQEWNDKINVIHCGIEMPETRYSPSTATGDDEPVSVLSVGQLMIRKGYHVLVDAARIVRDSGLKVKFTIVGEGNQRPLLEDKIAEYELHDSINLVGAQPHERIANFLDDADIFTLPCVVGDDNTRDGIPVAMMEAMAWRLPVVSTNIVGLPELIESGVDGILVEAESPQQLAEAIIELAKSPNDRKRIGHSALGKVEREFNSVRSARQLGDLFQRSYAAIK